jgi:heme-degrading monooxygenase HmoA
MIVRQWTGLAKPERVDDYLHHFRHEVLPGLHDLSGFLGASILRRRQTEGIQITVLTRWASMEAIRAFAGEVAEIAVVAETAKPAFISFDPVVSHHESLLETNA